MNFGNLSKFQLIFIALLVVIIIFAVIIFALGKSTSSNFAAITLWGTLPQNQFQDFLNRPEVTDALKAKSISVTYVEKPESTIDNDLIQALAAGKAPDAFLMTQDAIEQYADKVTLIPYASLTERSFKDAYVQEAELYLRPDGIEAIPFTIDPLVMYWNRDMFGAAGIATVPTHWSDFNSTLIPKLTQTDANHNITKSAIALGSFSNVTHAKELLSTLMLQAGTSITEETTSGLQSRLKNSGTTLQNPTEAALTFFTQYADPTKSIYSWNSSLPESRNAFAAGDLATYFGFASELNDIATRNPNLNFDVAALPQSAGATAKITYGKMWAIAALRTAPAPAAVFALMTALTNPQIQAIWSQMTGHPPIVRSQLSQVPTDAFQSVFYNGALQARGWLDPDRATTQTIFSSMVQSVVSGASTPSEAVSEADSRLFTYMKNAGLSN